jgi:hypothetical protein
MKTYKGINYTFAPAGYWSEADPLASVLRNVKGENRRQMIRDYLAAGKLEELDAALPRDEVDDEARMRLGRIHPSFMGGEYLPGYLPSEVEIARIALQSTTSDIISLRASRVPGGIAYRVVDEYEAVFVIPIPRSETPLTLTELIRQLDEGNIEGSDHSGHLSLGFNESNADGGDRETYRHFTTISSDFYPQLEEHYEKVFEEWVAEEVEEPGDSES